LCGLLSVAFLAPPESLRYAVQVRFEIYEALFVTLFFVCIQRGLTLENAALQFVSGLFSAAAGYSYYQFFPLVFIALSCLVVFNIQRGSALTIIAAAPLGFLATTAAFAMWIGRDFDWFLHQNMEFGRGYYPLRADRFAELQAYLLFAVGFTNLIYITRR